MARDIKLGDFERERGEQTRHGSPRVSGVQPQLGPIPIGIAPPFARQVISGYDSRPIGGYDFVISSSFSTYNSAADAVAQSPKGYVAVIRHIEVEADPGVVFTDPLSWLFVSNGVVTTNWLWKTGKYLSTAKLDTFLVVAPNTPFILRGLGFEFMPNSVVFDVRFSGNLILDTNEPPNEQVGSLPHAVKMAGA